MKINALQTPGLSGPPRTPGKGGVASKSDTAGGDNGDVKLSAASAQLATQQPGVDFAKVLEIRQAISEGRFEINASAIADRLISSARELVGRAG